jgi:hypothetical protein
MLDGVPKSVWEMGVVFRRILYPIIAYPFMKQWGFTLGGFITNLMLVSLGALGLFIFLYKKFGFRAALVGGLLFGSYPGLTYFGGLPYCYIFIAPATIFAFISLTWMDENPTCWRIISTSFFIGLLATGYDLLPFFLPVMVIILARHRRFLFIFPCAFMALAPLAFVIWYQKNITGISPMIRIPNY